MAGGGAGSKRSSRQAGNADRKGKGKRSKGSTKEPSLLASLHPTLLGLVFSFYCDCACEEGTFCPHTKDKADFDPCVCMDNCKKQGFPCRMQLRLVNGHWRNCLQAKEDLLNPTVFVDLREAGEEPIPLTVDCLIVTICKSDWLCDRVRRIMASPGDAASLSLDRFSNLSDLRIYADCLESCGKETLDRLTELVVVVRNVGTRCSHVEMTPFPPMPRLRSLSLLLRDMEHLFPYDLSCLGDSLPSLTSFSLDGGNRRTPDVALETPLALRQLTCDLMDICCIHLAGDFVETLYLTSDVGAVPTRIRCDTVVVTSPCCLAKWKTWMPVAKPKELRVYGGTQFRLEHMSLLLKTGIPRISITVLKSLFIKFPWVMDDPIENDVVVRFVFADCNHESTYIRSAVNHRLLESTDIIEW